jgi:hypothetical protein
MHRQPNINKATLILQYVNFTSHLLVSTLINATVRYVFIDSGGLEMTNLGRNMLP